MKPFHGLATFLIPCASIFSALPVSAATLFSNPNIPASEKQNMALVFQLQIPSTNPAWRNGTPIPYTAPFDLANAAALQPLFNNVANKRLGYYLEVGGEYAYVSMDAFDLNLSRIGYPHNQDNPVARQTIVNNANIYSNDTGISNLTGVSTVNLEMWPSNYGAGTNNATLGGSGTTFDWNDNGFNTSAGHGSFQIHNYGASQVIFGHSDWGGNGAGNSELGIGTFSGANPDWTFSDTGSSGFLQIFATIPEPSRVMLLLGGAIAMGLRRRRAA